jgi:hypothetical protein
MASDAGEGEAEAEGAWLNRNVACVYIHQLPQCCPLSLPPSLSLLAAICHRLRQSPFSGSSVRCEGSGNVLEQRSARLRGGAARALTLNKLLHAPPCTAARVGGVVHGRRAGAVHHLLRHHLDRCHATPKPPTPQQTVEAWVEKSLYPPPPCAVSTIHLPNMHPHITATCTRY